MTSIEVVRMLPVFQKRSGARQLGAHLSLDRNNSSSYLVFIEGIKRIAEEMGYTNGSL